MCKDGLSPLLGACADATTRAAFCGARDKVVEAGCQRKLCPRDEAIDLEDGECIPQKSGPFSANEGVDGSESRKLTCAPDHSLVLVGGDMLCAQNLALCGRGSRMASTKYREACESPRCAAGEVLDENHGHCDPIVTRDHENKVVNVARWAHAVIGVDGGAGSRTLCAPLLGHAEGRVSLKIDLLFPNDDISLVTSSVTVDLTDVRPIAASAAPSTNALAGLAQKSVLQTTSALRAMGGVATAAAVSLHLVCDLPALEVPLRSSYSQKP